MNCGSLVVAVWSATDQASGAAAVGSGAVPARRDLLQQRRQWLCTLLNKETKTQQEACCGHMGV